MKMKNNFILVGVLGLVVLTAGFGVVSSALGASVEMTTEVNAITHDDQPAWSIKQYGIDEPNDDISFVFEKLNTVAGGQFAGYQLLAVIITFEFSTAEVTLTVRNTSESAHTFKDTDSASLETRFSGGEGRKWDWGLDSQSLLDAGSNSIAQLSDFEGWFELELNDTITLEPTGQVGDSISEKGSFATIREGTVNSLFYDRYEGSGTWNFDVKNSYPVAFDIDGSGNLNVSGGTPAATFSTQVEYIVTPEPSTALLLAMLAGLGLLIRRPRV